MLAEMQYAHLLGVSSMTGWQIADCLKVSAAVKAKYPQVEAALLAVHAGLQGPGARQLLRPALGMEDSVGIEVDLRI